MEGRKESEGRKRREEASLMRKRQMNKGLNQHDVRAPDSKHTNTHTKYKKTPNPPTHTHLQRENMFLNLSGYKHTHTHSKKKKIILITEKNKELAAPTSTRLPPSGASSPACSTPPQTC